MKKELYKYGKLFHLTFVPPFLIPQAAIIIKKQREKSLSSPPEFWFRTRSRSSRKIINKNKNKKRIKIMPHQLYPCLQLRRPPWKQHVIYADKKSCYRSSSLYRLRGRRPLGFYPLSRRAVGLGWIGSSLRALEELACTDSFLGEWCLPSTNAASGVPWVKRGTVAIRKMSKHVDNYSTHSRNHASGSLATCTFFGKMTKQWRLVHQLHWFAITTNAYGFGETPWLVTEQTFLNLELRRKTQLIRTIANSENIRKMLKMK